MFLACPDNNLQTNKKLVTVDLLAPFVLLHNSSIVPTHTRCFPTVTGEAAGASEGSILAGGTSPPACQ